MPLHALVTRGEPTCSHHVERPRPLSGAMCLDAYPSSSFVPGPLPRFPYIYPVGGGQVNHCV